MSSISGRGIRKLCLKGVISPTDYWKWKKLKRLRINSSTSFWTRKPFKLDSFSEEECKKSFRFLSEDIGTLRVQLGIPQICKIAGHKSLVCSGIEAVCILLRRLVYPNRLFDLVKIFNRDESSLSRIFNWVLNKIFVDFGHKITSLDNKWLNQEKLLEFCEKINHSGSPFSNIVGFIDGTVRGICKPKYNQKDYYTGYKKTHVIKFQSICFPNGIIGRLDGPYQGRRHDTAILHLSDAIQQMTEYFKFNDGTWGALLGDTGYANQKFIKVGFKNHKKLTQRQLDFNAEISKQRISVEWGFGRILSLFSFLDYKKNQKLYKQPLKKYYIVATLLTNCYICLYGSQTSTYFDCEPPTLYEYLRD